MGYILAEYSSNICCGGGTEGERKSLLYCRFIEKVLDQPLTFACSRQFVTEGTVEGRKVARNSRRTECPSKSLLYDRPPNRYFLRLATLGTRFGVAIVSSTTVACRIRRPSLGPGLSCLPRNTAPPLPRGGFLVVYLNPPSIHPINPQPPAPFLPLFKPPLTPQHSNKTPERANQRPQTTHYQIISKKNKKWPYPSQAAPSGPPPPPTPSVHATDDP